MPSMPNPHEILFAGQRLLLDADYALYWPDQQCLIVSDLHLEKASFLIQFGALLPRYDTAHTLSRLAALIERYRPTRVVCLGDSFHDAKAYLRLNAEDREHLHHLTSTATQWDWVLGNHDPALDMALPGMRHTELTLSNLRLLHEPRENAQPQMVGHYHPKLTLQMGGQRISGKIFVHDEQLFIMPSFGSYTGGLDARNNAIASLFTQPSTYLIYRERIWKI